jgi:glycosyltransferase involved in cell wall biosynthesis
MQNYFVSVVIPVKNAEKTIRKTVNSVLEQSYENFEIIAVDDGSEDRTREVLEEFSRDKKIKLFRNKKSVGPAVTRNLGFRKAKGEIIFFTDSDCEVPRDWIEKILREYGDEKIAGVGGYLKPGKNNWVAKLELLQNKFILGIKNKRIIGKAKTPMGYTNNVSYRKEILEEVGGFDESFPSPAGEDIDLKKRVCEKYIVVYIPLAVIHLDVYDLDYLLKRIIVKGLNKSLPRNKFLKLFYVLFMFPLALFKILIKIIKYKIQKLI